MSADSVDFSVSKSLSGTGPRREHQISRRPVALYFTPCHWHKDNLALLEKHFNLHRAIAPTSFVQLGPEVEVAFVCPGMSCDAYFFKQFPNLKVIVSASTRTPFITLSNDMVKVICLEPEREFLNGITATAEHTLGLIHALHRRIPAAHQSVLNGCWNRRAWPAPRMLSQMRLGILGQGRIGRHLHRMAMPLFRGVRMSDNVETILGVGKDKTPDNFSRLEKGTEHRWQGSGKLDVLTIHLGLGHSGLVDQAIINELAPGALLVNTAQGDIVNLKHTIKALDSGQLRGFAADVLPYEPSPLAEWKHGTFDRPDIIFTPHIAGSTEDAWFATERKVIERTLEFFEL